MDAISENNRSAKSEAREFAESKLPAVPEALRLTGEHKLDTLLEWAEFLTLGSRLFLGKRDPHGEEGFDQNLDVADLLKGKVRAIRWRQLGHGLYAFSKALISLLTAVFAWGAFLVATVPLYVAPLFFIVPFAVTGYPLYRMSRDHFLHHWGMARGLGQDIKRLQSPLESSKEACDAMTELLAQAEAIDLPVLFAGLTSEPGVPLKTRPLHGVDYWLARKLLQRHYMLEVSAHRSSERFAAQMSLQRAVSTAPRSA